MNRFWLIAALFSLLVGCAVPGSIPQTSTLPSVTATPRPGPKPLVRLPQDEGPHNNLTEWWYYTGHLDAADGEYGFELTFFQVLRGQLPPIYIAHFAITDPVHGFRFAEKQEILRSRYEATGFEQGGFRLRIDDWTMEGRDGTDKLKAALPGGAIDLTLISTKPPALHDGDGLVHYGDAGFSYYYSRTRMNVSGTLTVDGVAKPVTGQAWMDHQWGDFLTLIGGGWDWFSVQLADGTDYMAYLIRDFRNNAVVGRLATRVGANGVTTDFPDWSLDITNHWRSPHTNAEYPAGWTIALPDGVVLRLTPTLADQELRTQATTGLAYWEGSVRVVGSRNGVPVTGRGYVELTGYAQ